MDNNLEKENIENDKIQKEVETQIDDNNVDNNQEEKKAKKKSLLKEIWEWAYMIAIAAAIAFLVNNFLITNSYIPTGSMEHTLPIGARVFGSRLAYKLNNIQRGDICVIDFGYICKNCEYMYQKLDPTHVEYLAKDLVSTASELEKIYEPVCPNCKRENSKNTKAYYIKRCIGIPGDKIEIKQDSESETSEFTSMNFKAKGKVKTGHVYVNGVKQEEPYLHEPMIVDDRFYKSFSFVVPENAYFFLGDNRNNSEDARFWVQTFIPKEQVIAKAGFMYWPLNQMGIVK